MSRHADPVENHGDSVTSLFRIAFGGLAVAVDAACAGVDIGQARKLANARVSRRGLTGRRGDAMNINALTGAEMRACARARRCPSQFGEPGSSTAREIDMKPVIANVASAIDDATFAATSSVPAVPLASSETPPGAFLALSGH